MFVKTYEFMDVSAAPIGYGAIMVIDIYYVEKRFSPKWSRLDRY